MTQNLLRLRPRSVSSTAASIGICAIATASLLCACGGRLADAERVVLSNAMAKNVVTALTAVY